MTAKKKPRGKPFAQGEDPRREGIAESEASSALVVNTEEGMLAAMQWVAQHPASEDQTYQQKEYRQWLRQNRSVFYAKKAELEKLSVQQSSALSTGSFASTMAESTPWDGVGPCPTCKRHPAVVDEGSERAKELCRRLLANDPP